MNELLGFVLFLFAVAVVCFVFLGYVAYHVRNEEDE
jgi:hypothetical protein